MYLGIMEIQAHLSQAVYRLKEWHFNVYLPVRQWPQIVVRCLREITCIFPFK